MDWQTKRIYWDIELKNQWPEAVKTLSRKGAKILDFSNPEEITEADIIFTVGRGDVHASCIPVLRTDKYPDQLCCDMVTDEMTAGEAMGVFERWIDIRCLASDLDLTDIPVVDKYTTESLERLAGPDVLRIGRGKFLKSATRYLREMELAKNGHKIEEVTKVLHTLKGSSGTIGARQMSRATKLIEDRRESEFDEAVFTMELNLLRMLLEYFRYESIEWENKRSNGEKNFNG